MYQRTAAGYGPSEFRQGIEGCRSGGAEALKHCRVPQCNGTTKEGGTVLMGTDNAFAEQWSFLLALHTLAALNIEP
jgi:hypothetical protein